MLFYRAFDGVTADIIPFFENGTFYLFYLHDFRNVGCNGEGTPWRLITTKDFVNYEEHGEVIARGTEEEQDLYVFTGSVFKEAEGKYHIFYTGHNPHLRAKGKPEQGVMHAVSSDLLHWTKICEDTFFAPEDNYEPHDWRDPFVYYDKDTENYKMLLAARHAGGDKIKKGCTALCTSLDLKTWTVQEPIWSPNAFFAHECPDYFNINGYDYMIYSEFTDRCLTRYRISKEGENLWRSAIDDAFDGRAFYAAKTASDGEKRYIFGWNPTKDGEHDKGEWQWGGNLTVHQIIQREDASLGTKIPDSIRNSFINKKFTYEKIQIGREDGFESFPLPEIEEETYCLSGSITFNNTNICAGFQLNHNRDEDFSYAYMLEVPSSQITFGPLPNSPWGRTNFTNVKRPIQLECGKSYHFNLLVEGNVCILYFDDVALSSRMYIDTKKDLSLYSMNGKVIFENLELFTQ